MLFLGIIFLIKLFLSCYFRSRCCWPRFSDYVVSIMLFLIKLFLVSGHVVSGHVASYHVV